MSRTRVGWLALVMLVAASPGGAQIGFVGCTATVAVEPARYLGRNAGRDSVEVAWGGPVREIVPLGSGGGGLFGDNPAAVCAARQGLVGSYQTSITLIRRLGHRDSASTNGGAALDAGLQRTLQVPRAALETDPTRYEIAVDGTVNGTFTVGARATGPGSPALTGATLAGIASVPGLNGNCSPSLTMTSLALAPGGDAVNVSWSNPSLALSCLRPFNTSVQVKLTRPDGTTVTRSASPGTTATSVQVPLGQPAGQVASFEVTVSTALTSTLTLRGRRAGDF
jgi:hypothetical protein